MSDEKNRRILVVDDNRSIHEDFHKILANRNESNKLHQMQEQLFGVASERTTTECYDLDSAYQGREGYEKVCRSMKCSEPYALAFVDMRMPPGWDGLETIEKIWSVDPALQVVICTAYSDHSWEDILNRFGAGDRLLILKKPFDTVEVCQLACALTEKWQLAKHARLKLDQLNSMVRERTAHLLETNKELQEEVASHQQTETELRRSQHRYALAAAAANDGLWDWDVQRNTVFYSTRWKEMLGYSEAEVGDSLDEWYNRIDPDHLDLVQTRLYAHFSGEREHLSIEYRIKHKDGQYRWMFCRGLAHWAPDGSPLQIVGSQTDITDRRLAEEQLRHQAMHDALTGLANRSLLLERLSAALRRSRQDPRFQFAVLFLDLDHFKVINDSLGHSLGDKLLQAVAKRLVSAMPALDTTARMEQDCLARLGGDEFVVLLDSPVSPDNAVAVAERLQRSLSEAFHLDGKPLFISASIGIALGGESYATPEELLRDADAALYEAKGTTKGRCAVFNPDLHAKAMARWEMENELHRAIEHEQLRLQFQPIVSLSTGRVKEMEALVRWAHPERGIIAPGEFISVAEESGLILPLGSWVLREACARWREWQSFGRDGVSVGVNVSGRQFAQPDIVDEIRRLLREFQMAPHCLKLEITESVLMENTGATTDNLARLRDLGVRFHLDDFGTGYSSLSYLHRMPIDALKIDRSFISNMMTDRTSGQIVQAVIALAKALGVDVIAEGVENENQLGRLIEMGSSLAQGFYFAEPVDVEEIRQVMSQEYPVGLQLA